LDFEQLYEANVDAVYGYLMFKLNDEQLAEDILQETFLAVHQGMQKNDEISSPKAWLLSIAHNKMVDCLRKRRIVESGLDFEVAADLNENHSNVFLQEALGQLADTERTIVYGLYVEGLTCRELAQILALPEGTVKSKAHYARKHLYHWLQEGSK